jgi:hypothetical protein
MFGIDTASVAAQVINRVLMLKRSDEQLIGHAMSQQLLPAPSIEPPVEVSVAIGACRAIPLPTTVHGDELGPEPLFIGGLAVVRHCRNYTTQYTRFIGEQLLRALGAEREAA